MIEFPRNLVLGSPRRCLPLYGVLSYFKSSTKAVVDCTKSMEVGMVSTHPPFQGIVRAVSLAALLGESSQSLFFLRSIPPPTPLRESCPCPTLLQEPTAIYASGHSCHVVCLLNRLSRDYLGRSIHRKARAKARHGYKYRNHRSHSGGTPENPTNRLGPLTYPFSFFPGMRCDHHMIVRTES